MGGSCGLEVVDGFLRGFPTESDTEAWMSPLKQGCAPYSGRSIYGSYGLRQSWP